MFTIRTISKGRTNTDSYFKMPTSLLDRIPLPNLKLYTTISVLLLSGCVYYAINATSDPYWRMQNNSTIMSSIVSSGGTTSKLNDVITDEELNDLNINNNNSDIVMNDNDVDSDDVSDNSSNDRQSVDAIMRFLGGKMESSELIDEKLFNEPRTFSGQFHDIVAFMSQEPICIWTLINMAYCLLILMGKSIQKIVFGELRISEQQHMKDKFWNFIFYKFIFVFGVVNVQYMHEVVLWVSWFSVLGFLHLLSQLCKDRFEYLSFSPTTPGWSHFRLVALLSSILTISGVMFIICIGVGLMSGINTFAFMAAECVLLSIRTLHVLIRYGMFLYDMRNGGISNEAISWDKRGPVAYYIELVFEVAALIIDLLHHLHMLLWSNIFLSMASLVIIMQLRYLSHEIQRKVKKHRNYLWVLNHMEKSYPLATADDLNQNSDNCAICWEKMETARKLPCGHLFHNSCLQSWLEQDTSCPTCRLALSVQNNNNILHQADRIIDERDENGGRANNHFFHFNGSRYVSWLPNFSVEVTHVNNVLRNDTFLQNTGHTSQLRNMARQVQQMFPRFPMTIIIADLQMSRSMEITVDNILEGRLQIPARFQEFNAFDEDDFQDTNTSNTTSNDTTTVDTTASTISTATETSRRENLNFQTPNDYYVNPTHHGGSFTDDASMSPPSTANSRTTDDAFSYSTESGYEIEKSSTNIFGNQHDLLKDDNSFEEMTIGAGAALGDRFSKSSIEREKILQRRKEMLLQMARRRYLDKNKSELNMPLNNSSNNNNNNNNNSSCSSNINNNTSLSSSSNKIISTVDDDNITEAVRHRTLIH